MTNGKTSASLTQKTGQFSRLKILKETDDGFEIAENDLILRGHGEILGSKQSGNIDFKFVDLHIHGDLISLARKEAEYLLASSSSLTVTG